MLNIELDRDVFEALLKHLEAMEAPPPLLATARDDFRNVYDNESERYWLDLWNGV
jgi:hypothetical protein